MLQNTWFRWGSALQRFDSRDRKTHARCARCMSFGFAQGLQYYTIAFGNIPLFSRKRIRYYAIAETLVPENERASMRLQKTNIF